jgi:hypothetical protein
LLQQKKTFIAARNTQHVRGRPPEENQGLHRAGHYFFLETKTNQAREGKKNFSLSLCLSLSLASQFLKTLLAAAFEASSARKLAATTIRNKSKLTRSPALPSLSLSLSVHCFFFRVFWETLDWGMVIGTRGKKGTNGL